MMNAKKTKLKVVVGLGLTGLSCVRYFKKLGIPVAVTDSREQTPQLETLRTEFPDVRVEMAGFSESLMSEADELIVSPGVWLKEPAVAKYIAQGIPAIGDIELFARKAKAPVIAITGSNGKTTVTTLMGQIVQEAGFNVEVCGNIGQPVLDIIDKPPPDFYVMELSSFQLETTYSLKPETSVVLNVSPDHMDRYLDYQEYIQAKQRIYLGCKHAVVNWDEPEAWSNLASHFSSSFTLGVPHAGGFGVATIAGQEVLVHGNKKLLSARELKLNGRHHLQNALACLALSHAAGISLDHVLTVLKRFTGLKHRCQWVSNKRGVQWYDDSKGTNVGATVAAINTMGPMKTGQIILIAGGDAKNADLHTLKSPVQKYISHVILLGKDAKRIEEVLDGAVTMTHVKTLEEAVEKAANLAGENDIVLLSPACASLDMFRNYEHRAEVFVNAVNALSDL